MSIKLRAVFAAAALATTVFTACSGGAAGTAGSSGSSASSVAKLVSPASSRAAASAASHTDTGDEQLYAKAMADYAAHNYDGCVAVSDQALAADPNCSWAYNMKGIAIYFANGNKVADECIGLIDKSIEINPQYGYGYFNKALILKGLRRWDDSVASFNKALEFMPGDTWSYYGIATVYGDTNQVDKALQYLKLAIDADKAPPSVKRRAKEEVTTHFARMKNDPRFLALVNS